MKTYTKCLLLILVGLFISLGFLFAESDGGGDGGSKKSECRCRSEIYTYDVYSCIGNCPGRIKKESWTDCTSSCCKDSDPCKNYPILNYTTEVTGEDWQVCVGGPYRDCHKYCSSSPDSYKPYFACGGSCLSNISSVRYYSNPYYPQKPELTIQGSDDYPNTCSAEDLQKYPLQEDCIEPSNGSTDVKLPLKIDWDEDAYWLEKNGKYGYFSTPKGVDVDGSKSYKISLKLTEEKDDQVVNLVSPPTKAAEKSLSDYISKNFEQDEKEINEGYFIKVLNTANQPNYIGKGVYRSSEYNFRVDHNPCWLKSGQEYDLVIQTCCGADGTNCNTGSTLKFETAYAPELKSPEDLDWEGAYYSAWNAWPYINTIDKLPLSNTDYKPFDWDKNVPKLGLKIEPPVLLDWCDVDSNKLEHRTTNSYSILPKIFETVPDTNVIQKVCAFNKGITDELCYHISAPVTLNLFSEYSDIDNFVFLKNSIHSWKVRGCPTVMAGICSARPYSQEWYFETTDSDLGENTNIVPADGSIVGLPVSVSWVNSYGYIAYVLEFYKGGTLLETKELSSSGNSYNDLDLKTTYQWRFKNCTDRYYKNCDDWSPFFKFTVTGDAPTLISPSGAVIPPLDFKWNTVPGAKSYVLKIEGDGINKEIKTTSDYLKLEYSADFPLKVNTSYNWQVKTCADRDGNKCGDYSAPLIFTVKLDTPTGLKPENKVLSLYEDKGAKLTWDNIDQVKTYQISFDYEKGIEEVSTYCENLEGKENIVTRNEYFFSPQCLGNYTWKVRSCFSDNCEQGTFSEWSEYKTFTLFQNVDPETGEKVSEKNENTKSIVPCGRPLDDPDTPWNEREACAMPHLLIILRNILDFVLGRLIPLVIAGSVVYSGLKFFTSLGNPNVIVQIKDLWKYIGIGFLIILFSITAIDFFLTFLGYNIGIFGNLLK